MEIITIFYVKDGCVVDKKEIATSSWYHTPSILRSFAYYVNKHEPDLIVPFVCSSKYGCKQFTPYNSKSFPIIDHLSFIYKGGLPWVVFEFNYCSLTNPITRRHLVFDDYVSKQSTKALVEDLSEYDLRLIAMLCSKRLEVLGYVDDSSSPDKKDIYHRYNSLYSKVCNALSVLSHGNTDL